MQIDANQQPAVVTDVDDLRRLEVLAPADLPDADLAARLGQLGRLDGDHVRLSVAHLRQAGPADAGWAQGFDGMIAYAGSKGWVEGDAVRAHVVRT
ncbi:hypothetical protein SAMN03159343_2523 [Klenkia marina]|uniref:Uncharacterized protein n=1 Tax=Klenkia marina TaxID=1960309 RepID=A0A1G4YC26_9ACTN|nr:hypothetical protein [Klenkia marina]SCX50964.1 hypothetical protein SAMN03159343_2523 [Klenkia marina]